MIKSTDYKKAVAQESDTSRIDALALAFGFKFEGGVYVKSVKKRRAPKRKVVRVPKKLRPVFLPDAFYEQIGALEVGENLNISNYVIEAGISLRNVKQRLHSWGYGRTKFGQVAKKFTATRTGGQIIATRTL